MLNEGNFEEFLVGYEIIDEMTPNLEGSELNPEQVNEIKEMLNQVRVFREAFNANGWDLNNYKISIPLFFILSDLIAKFDDSVKIAIRVHRNLENLIDGNSQGIHPHIRALRKDLLANQMHIAKNTIAHNANQVIDLLFNVINFLQREDEILQRNVY